MGWGLKGAKPEFHSARKSNPALRKLKIKYYRKTKSPHRARTVRKVLHP
ncbi:hypothetical protein predicted by Glimmer/Critica [Bdellovibrio bacteriovorus HD100]|uniref:Uncharacterized protein n=1 Tax=Bdellovibrio bacteriovorus (strain ATCC 15356 / DSM 50701 / NCIMB 9529 / HD100) TaxID=264462 RepID=Q6MJ07_BDEBA|nr:hypothetical protein predicted by Glimmer/Critica [Bdellovibrio bacteriovorus HD100]